MEYDFITAFECSFVILRYITDFWLRTIQFIVLTEDSMISNFIGDFQNKNHKYLCMWPQKNESLFSKAAKIGQWPDPKTHSSPRKKTSVKVSCSGIIHPQVYVN